MSARAGSEAPGPSERLREFPDVFKMASRTVQDGRWHPGMHFWCPEKHTTYSYYLLLLLSPLGPADSDASRSQQPSKDTWFSFDVGAGRAWRIIVLLLLFTLLLLLLLLLFFLLLVLLLLLILLSLLYII